MQDKITAVTPHQEASAAEVQCSSGQQPEGVGVHFVQTVCVVSESVQW